MSERPGSVGAQVRRLERMLAESGASSPRLDAELIVAGALGIGRATLYSWWNESFPAASAPRIEEAAARRAGGEPLQYIRGTQEFHGREMAVSPAVLIPRPETELLVDAALEELARRPGMPRVADVGTGSGCIAVTVALECPAAEVIGCDVSGAALEVAGRNALRHGAPIRLVRGDLLGWTRPAPAFDAILSNPPYIGLVERPALQREVVEHEPPGALFAGRDGLEIIRRLLPEAFVRLRPGGLLLMEMGAGHANAVLELARSAGFSSPRVRPDLAGRERLLEARR